MNVDNFVHEQMVDENGYLTYSWALWFNQLINQLQKNVGPEGYVVPSLEATKIAQLTGPSTQDGTLVYDSTNNLLKVRIAGVFKTVQTI